MFLANYFLLVSDHFLKSICVLCSGISHPVEYANCDIPEQRTQIDLRK